MWATKCSGDDRMHVLLACIVHPGLVNQGHARHIRGLRRCFWQGPF